MTLDGIAIFDAIVMEVVYTYFRGQAISAGEPDLDRAFVARRMAAVGATAMWHHIGPAPTVIIELTPADMDEGCGDPDCENCNPKRMH